SRALQELFVAGIKTNTRLFQRILEDESFRAGKIDTGYLERLLGAAHRSGAGETRKDAENVAAIAAAVFAMFNSKSKTDEGGATGAGSSGWKRTARAEGLM